MIQLNRILIPTDFSDFSNLALNYGCELAKKFQAELHLLSVVEDVFTLVPDFTGIPPGAQDYVTDQIQHFHLELEKLPGPQIEKAIRVERKVVLGIPLVEILRYAKEEEMDMIVMGTHGRTGLKHVFLGSVAEAVVRQSPCPVLTTRLTGHQFIQI